MGLTCLVGFRLDLLTSRRTSRSWTESSSFSRWNGIPSVAGRILGLSVYSRVIHMMSSGASSQRGEGYSRRVVLVGTFADPGLLGRTLERAGFLVHTATVEQALDNATELNAGALIIGVGLAVKDRIRVAQYARRHNPNVRIIVLYRGSIDNAEMADAVLNAAVDPQDLLQALKELLTGMPKKTGLSIGYDSG